jgi:hypothetical protein
MPYCFVEGARCGCVVVEWISLIDIQLAVTKELILRCQQMAKIHMCVYLVMGSSDQKI